jgi:hypothetical protein
MTKARKVPRVANDTLLVVRMPAAFHAAFARAASKAGFDVSKAVRFAMAQWMVNVEGKEPDGRH